MSYQIQVNCREAIETELLPPVPDEHLLPPGGNRMPLKGVTVRLLHAKHPRITDDGAELTSARIENRLANLLIWFGSQ